jgi:hypothetical protein
VGLEVELEAVELEEDAHFSAGENSGLLRGRRQRAAALRIISRNVIPDSVGRHTPASSG